MNKLSYRYDEAAKLTPSDSRIAYHRGATRKYEPRWGTIYSGSYSFTTQISGYTVARLSYTNGLKKTQSQPESRRNHFVWHGPLSTLPDYYFFKRIRKPTGSPHPSTPSDHPGGHAVGRANSGPPRCSSTDARALPFSHAG